MEKTYEKITAVTAPPTEVAEDFALADYQGDIQKILATKARLAPAGAYRDGDTLKYGGVVVFEVLYADAEGKLTGVSHTADYDISFAAPENAEARDFSVTVEGVSVRPGGPRKIAMRATLVARAELVTREPFPEIGGEGLQTRDVTVHTVEKTALAPSEREYAENTGVLRGVENAEVLFTDGKLAVTDKKLRDDGVEVSGEVSLLAVVRGEGGVPLPVRKTISFSELLSGDGKDGKFALASGDITSLSVTANAEGGGTSLAFDCIVELRAAVLRETVGTVAVDAYALDYESEPTYGNFPSVRCLYGGVAKVSVRENVEKPTDCTAMRDILFQSAEAKTESTVVTPTALTVTGKVAFYYVGAREDENGVPVYCHEKTEIPFETTVPLDPGEGEGRRADVGVCISRVEVKIEPSGVSLSCDLLLHLSVFACREETVLSSLSLSTDRPVPRQKNVIRVLCPDKNETLWDVAKANHLPLSKLLSDNRLSEIAVSSGEFQMPKKLYVFE